MAKRKKSQRKVNVLFVLIGLGLGGSERVVLDLARNMDKSIFNVYVVSFSGGQLYQDFSKACTKLFYVKKRGGYDLSTIFQIARIIKKYDIHVINAHHYAPFVYSYPATKLLNNKSLIFTEHSVPEVVGLSGKHKHLCNILFYRTDAIIGVSREITQSLQETFPLHSNKMMCIPNGVDVERFAVHVDRNIIRSELGILPSDFVIGTVANFRKVKNHLCLIKAFHLIAGTFPHARLLFVGKGFGNAPDDSEKDIKKLVNSLRLSDRIVFAGYRDDIPLLLNALDIFCLPSFSEGLPISILEAMASKISVVGSDVTGIKEVISPEKTGIMFPSNDHKWLAQVLERLIKDADLRSALTQRAFDFVVQEHGVKKWVNKYQLLFESV